MRSNVGSQNIHTLIPSTRTKDSSGDAAFVYTSLVPEVIIATSGMKTRYLKLLTQSRRENARANSPLPTAITAISTSQSNKSPLLL